MVGAQGPQLALAGGDLALLLVEQAQAGLERAPPGLGQLHPLEQRPAARAEQVGAGAGVAEGDQRLVDARLERRALLHQEEPEAGPLALGAHPRVGQPDRRHQLAARELGQHPGVDAVGLAGKRRQALHLARVGDLDLPAQPLEQVVDEAGAGHRFDRGADRLSVAADALGEPRQPVGVGRGGTDLDRRAALVEQVEVETAATEIQSGVQHCNGPPLGSSWWTSRSLPPRRPSFITFRRTHEQGPRVLRPAPTSGA